MERMNEYIKDRTEAFDDLFPCRKPKFEHVKNWFKAFMFFYNYVFTNEKIGSAPLSNEQLSEWIKPICGIKLMAPFKLSVLEQKASEQLDLRELKGPRARVNSYSFKLIYINYSVKEWREKLLLWRYVYFNT